MDKELRAPGINTGINKSMNDGQTPVVATLRRQILLGQKAAGEKLNQEDIAQELNVSRIPVREAFKILEGEGLVRIEPYRGAWVSSFSEKDVRDVYEMRKVLEPMALTLAFELLSKTDLGAAEDILEQMDYDADALETSEQNWDFHSALYRPCERRHLMETLAKLHTASQHMTLIGWAVEQRYDISQSEHYDILNACKNRDLPAAIQHLERHTEEAMLSTITALIKSKVK